MMLRKACLILALLAGLSLTAHAVSVPEDGPPETREISEETQEASENLREAFLTAENAEKDYVWKENDNGTVTVFLYTGNASRVIVPGTFDGLPVTAIYNTVFAGNTTLRSVDLPENVRYLAAGAFRNCTNLESITLPGTLRSTTIPQEQLMRDGRYHQVKDPSNADGNISITTINAGTPFPGCTSLRNVTFTTDMEAIPAYLFQNCTALREIEIPNKITTIGQYAFSGCTSLSSVTFFEPIHQLTMIDSYAFFGCTALPEISLPEGLITIGSYAFSGCTALRKIDLHTRTVGAFAFADCSLLSDITFEPGLVSIGDYAFSNCNTLPEAVLPEGMTSLGDYAFTGCTAMERVTIPSTLTTAASPFAPSGSMQGCILLNDITFGEGISAIPATLFNQCLGLTHIEIPDTVISIGANAFTGILVQPNGINSNLKAVTIPDSVQTIGASAFQYCALESIEFPDSVTEYGNNCVRNCLYMKHARLSANASVIPTNMFQYCIALESVELPEGVTQIREGMFQDCYALTGVNMPDTITEVQSSAFQNCKRLTDVVWSKNLTSIGQNAFYGCEALRKAHLPDSVSAIGDGAFQLCSALNDLILSDGLTYIPQNAFAQCVALPKVVIPGGVTEIRARAFYQDTGLQAITLPRSVVSISEPDAISYPERMTVYGVKGTYAQTWAESHLSKFVDTSNPAVSIYLSGHAEVITLLRGITMAPSVEMEAERADEECTDVVSFSSADESVVSVEGGNSLKGNNTGTAVVTATASNGAEYSFTVYVEDITALNIVQMPDRTDFVIGEEVDATGMIVNAVYTSGRSEKLEGWTLRVPQSYTQAQTPGAYAIDVQYQYSNMTVSTSYDVELYRSENDIPLYLGPVTFLKKTIFVRAMGGDNPSGIMTAAAYDESGKMLACRVRSGLTTQMLRNGISFDLDLTGAARVAVFLTSDAQSGLVPLCRARRAIVP